LVVNGLPEDEQERILRSLGFESGYAFRQMLLGNWRVPRERVRCPVLCLGGEEDRMVSPAITKRLAARYGARVQIFERLGHWLIAPSATGLVATAVLRWLEAILSSRSPGPSGRRASALVLDA
jgi:pimeloyl-ACP methyl ester carboxylesterase